MRRPNETARSLRSDVRGQAATQPCSEAGLQQLPFFACPGGQKPLRPAGTCVTPGSTTTEPDGVYTAQPAIAVTNQKAAARDRIFFMK